MVTSIEAQTGALSPAEVEQTLARGFANTALDGKRTLVIIPDGTRTAPIPLLFALLGETLGARVAALDYLIALGTHPPMAEEAIDALVGVSAAERERRYPGVQVFNHEWDHPDQLARIGVIAADEAVTLSDGLLKNEIPVTLNRKLLEYEHIIICGPVFPHEVAGFSGGAKYLFPGVAGPDIINFTHWLGALVTSMATIGVKDTPVRRVIHRAVPVRGVIPQTVDVQVQQAVGAGLADQAQFQRRQVFRKDADNVKTHYCPAPSVPVPSASLLSEALPSTSLFTLNSPSGGVRRT